MFAQTNCLIHNLIAIPQDEELHMPYQRMVPRMAELHMPYQLVDGTKNPEVHMFKVQTSDSTN